MGHVILDGLAAWENPQRDAGRMLHTIGDGRFVADDPRLDRHEAMRSKLPDGV